MVACEIVLLFGLGTTWPHL